ncbi:Helix-turn-helix domain-containing protein [Kytococcus aerolatus]|uniref:Helix-turn-helix domain-containing protein n=1 Tax=Kytococcus aerolatus TaxID=592308 RepID=A0A212T5U7_9MICO|nr:helix-turn-helix transcriptional regulator [Kytococcus aerolatus]SNC61433.1 Helix-turn-helix domain-containing protein [Kytococcus aerolatus]
MVVMRREVGDVLRERRLDQGRTLRQVSSDASVSLGYLSEVERGEKEASSEMLATICRALHLPMSEMLTDVAMRVAVAEAEEAMRVPDSLAELPAGTVRRREPAPVG